MASSSNPPPDSEEPETRNWLDLPREVTSVILFKLGAIEILRSAQWVCTPWWRICKDPLMWRTIDMRFSGAVTHLEILCRLAIDRSCGHLEDITIEYFGTHDLLTYIADSGCHLRCLRLVCCYAITDKGLSEAVTRFPWLEELDISRCFFLSKNALQAIGQSCPLLKCLKFNRDGNIYPAKKCDEEAYAIAETMPKLRHLEIIGNELTDDGLVAIFDGCPQLESLDLWHCRNVDFGGGLQRRCDEQLKNLWYPNDSTDDDYTFDAENNHGMDWFQYWGWLSNQFPQDDQFDIDIDSDIDDEFGIDSDIDDEAG